ncbi:MAG: hypothetical protein WCF84_13395 [Anaerolineae bacterium]
MPDIHSPRTRVRALLSFFIVALLLAGLTAFPLQWELALLYQWAPFFEHVAPSLVEWIGLVNRAIQESYGRYSFLAYGTDWLAFAHIVIAIAFVGPLRDPVRNIWVVEWGMIACVLIVPLALIMGPVRGIPLFWTVVDCSFGVFGIIPLWFCRRETLRLEQEDKSRRQEARSLSVA